MLLGDSEIRMMTPAAVLDTVRRRRKRTEKDAASFEEEAERRPTVAEETESDLTDPNTVINAPGEEPYAATISDITTVDRLLGDSSAPPTEPNAEPAAAGRRRVMLQRRKDARAPH